MVRMDVLTRYHDDTMEASTHFDPASLPGLVHICAADDLMMMVLRDGM